RIAHDLPRHGPAARLRPGLRHAGAGERQAVGVVPVDRGDRRDLSLQGWDDAGARHLFIGRDGLVPGGSRYTMRSRLKPLFIALLGGTLVTAIAAAQNATSTIDIDAMQPGAAPPGFTFWRTGNGPAAEWRVVADPTAAGQKAIAQTSKDTTDYRFPLAVYQPVSAKNVDVQVHFKPVA